MCRRDRPVVFVILHAALRAVLVAEAVRVALWSEPRLSSCEIPTGEIVMSQRHDGYEGPVLFGIAILTFIFWNIGIPLWFAIPLGVITPVLVFAGVAKLHEPYRQRAEARRDAEQE